MLRAGPKALRLGRAEWVWLGPWAVTVLVPVATVGAGWALRAGQAAVWEGKWEPPYLARPTHQGQPPISFQAPSWACVGVSVSSVSGKLPVLFQLCFPISRLVPKVVLSVSGTPGASLVGAGNHRADHK